MKASREARKAATEMILLKVVERDPDGRPATFALIAEDAQVELAGGEEFITACVMPGVTDARDDANLRDHERGEGN